MFELLSIHIGFLEIRILDIIDIFLVAILLFYVYKLLRGSIAFNIIIGIAFLYLTWFLVKTLNMKMLSTILGQFIGLGVLAFVILFQPEIRKFLLLLGKSRTIAKIGILKNVFQQAERDYSKEINSIAKAFYNLSNSKTGALIVISGSSQLQFICATGVSLNADISAKLLESIFEKKSPLHDGALIISDDKILAAGCTLTLSENQNLPKRIGTRHRAAVGVSENSDAMAFLVSEETGKISVTQNGKLEMGVSLYQLKRRLKKAFTFIQ